MSKEHKIIIVGGGLSGLTLAYLLQKRGIPSTVLEASSRLGGRIQTVSGNLNTPLELGATWFSAIHPNLLALIQELDLTTYPQFSEGISLFQTKSFEPPQKFYIPASESPSFRIAGGTQRLIDKLAEGLHAAEIQVNTKVTEVRESGNQLTVETTSGISYQATTVILCLPPQLVAAQITCTPPLPDSLREVLPDVQTWMAGALKFAVEYAEPFWRQQGYSGMLFSHADIVVEMYDHTNFEGDKYGFTGFLNGGAAAYSQSVRQELVLTQLGQLLGEKALQPTGYYDKVWADEFVQAGSQRIQRPHQLNGHPSLQKGYYDGKLFFCGTETATEFPGYMEGAVVAAKQVASRL